MRRGSHYHLNSLTRSRGGSWPYLGQESIRSVTLSTVTATKEMISDLQRVVTYTSPRLRLLTLVSAVSGQNLPML